MAGCSFHSVGDYVRAFPRLHSLLRAERFSVSPTAWVDAHQLLLRLAEQGQLEPPAHWWAYARLLSPLFSTTYVEQQRFLRLFERWATGEQVSAPRAVAPAAALERTVRRVERRMRWPYLAIAFASVVLLATTLSMQSPAPTTPPSPRGGEPSADPPAGPNPALRAPEYLQPLPVPPRRPPPPTVWDVELPLPVLGPRSVPPLAALRWALLLLCPALAAAWVARRLLQQRRILERRRAGANDFVDKLVFHSQHPQGAFAGDDVARAAASLRRGPATLTRRLNVDATVDQTVRRAGEFRAVYAQTTRQPAYLVLLDTRYRGASAADLANDLVRQLQSLHLNVTVCEFKGDPTDSWRRSEPRGRHLSLRQLAERFGHARLLVLSDGASLVQPLSGQPQPWLAQLTAWPSRMWLTSAPAPWGHREQVLAQQGGFAVAPLSGPGVAALERWMAEPGVAANAPWFEPSGGRLPTLLGDTRFDWLSERIPTRRDVDQLSDALRAYLGAPGYQLLLATIAFPELDWRLTVGLEHALHPDASPDQREERLLRLVRLPWFERGGMPNPLRAALLKRAAPADFDAAHGAWRALFAQRKPSRRADAHRVEVARRHWLQGLAWRREGYDRVFASVLFGRKPGLLSFELPEWLARRLPGYDWPVSQVLCVAVLAGLGSVVLTSAWSWWAQSWVEQELLARQRAANAALTVNIATLPPSEERASGAALATLLANQVRARGYAPGAISTVEVAPVAAEPALLGNTVFLGAGVDEAQGARLAALLRAQTWGGSVVVVDDASDGEFPVPGLSPPSPNTVLVALAEPYRTGSVFRDAFLSTSRRVGQPIEPTMVRIPAGTFLMGSPEDEEGREDNEGPLHQVTVPAFELAESEVTKAEFRVFIEDTGYATDAATGPGCFTSDDDRSGWDYQAGTDWDTPRIDQSEQHPAVCVSWNDAKAYVDWLNARVGGRYRLPTEAEWEYAVRGGTMSSRWWGDEPDAACAYATVYDQATARVFPGDTAHECDDGFVYTSPARTYEANPFGLYDMVGNAWEWTEDCWHDSYVGAPSDGSPWVDSEEACSGRVLRGGSWVNFPDLTRSAFRGWAAPEGASGSVGFRLARTL